MGISIISDDKKVEFLRLSYTTFLKFRISVFAWLTNQAYGTAASNYLINLGEVNIAYIQKYKNYPGLIMFLLHSDHDGLWTWQECNIIASKVIGPVLQQAREWKDNNGNNGDWYIVTKKFYDGLVYCSKNELNAIFR